MKCINHLPAYCDKIGIDINKVDVSAAISKGFINQAANVLDGSTYSTGESGIGPDGAHLLGNYNCDDFENS